MGKLKSAVKKSLDGATLNLFITPNADTTIFPAGFNEWRSRIEVKIRSPAKDNLANLEVIKKVAKFFNKPIKNVYVISGKKTKEKTVLVKDVTVSIVVKKLRESLDGL